jgi:hypothetical protein
MAFASPSEETPPCRCPRPNRRTHNCCTDHLLRGIVLPWIQRAREVEQRGAAHEGGGGRWQQESRRGGEGGCRPISLLAFIAATCPSRPSATAPMVDLMGSSPGRPSARPPQALLRAAPPWPPLCCLGCRSSRLPRRTCTGIGVGGHSPRTAPAGTSGRWIPPPNSHPPGSAHCTPWQPHHGMCTTDDD